MWKSCCFFNAYAILLSCVWLHASFDVWKESSRVTKDYNQPVKTEYAFTMTTIPTFFLNFCWILKGFPCLLKIKFGERILTRFTFPKYRKPTLMLNKGRGLLSGTVQLNSVYSAFLFFLPTLKGIVVAHDKTTKNYFSTDLYRIVYGGQY